MCGRYTLATSVDELARQFEIGEYPASIPPSYNVAPTQNIAAVVAEGEARKLEMLRWGLVPSWADDPEIGARMINARSETVAEKPSFRKAFRERRCLILADGFYEWRRMESGKQPYYIRMKDERPFAFAGLWESWGRDGDEVRSCAILTTEPNGLVRGIHNRMPVILPPENYPLWLDHDFDEREALESILESYPAGEMEAYPVSRAMNSPSHDVPGCIKPAA